MRRHFHHPRLNRGGHIGLTLGFLGLLFGVAFFLADKKIIGNVTLPYEMVALFFAGYTLLLSLVLIGKGLQRR